MYDKPLKQEGYFIVSDCDLKKVVEYMKECRGSQGWGYGLRSGVPTKFFRSDYTRSTRVPTSILQNAIKYEDVNSSVTINQMLAANGMISEEKVYKVVDSMMPEITQKKDLRFLDYYDEEDRVSDLPMAKSGYDDFLADLAEYSQDLEKECIAEIAKRCEEIYESAAVVTLLKKFQSIAKQSSDARRSSLEAYFSAEESGMKSDTLCSKKTSVCEKYLKKMLQDDFPWLDD